MVRSRRQAIPSALIQDPSLLQDTDMTSVAERDPRHHTENMKKRRSQSIDHLRQDIDKVDEPQLKAMFETSAEVLGGLVKAFSDYERKNEGDVNRTRLDPVALQGAFGTNSSTSGWSARTNAPSACAARLTRM